MALAAIIVFIYGLFTLVGGIIGFVKAKSRASLIAGSLSGLALLVSAYGMNQGMQAASIVSFVIAILLGARFLKTWLTNRRVMPDLLMVILSIATLIAVSVGFFK